MQVAATDGPLQINADRAGDDCTVTYRIIKHDTAYT